MWHFYCYVIELLEEIMPNSSSSASGALIELDDWLWLSLTALFQPQFRGSVEWGRDMMRNVEGGDFRLDPCTIKLFVLEGLENHK